MQVPFILWYGVFVLSHSINAVNLLRLPSIGTTCQQKDWPSHKEDCLTKSAEVAAAEGKKWYDRYRKCKDGTQHFGELELITWGGRDPTFGEEIGWGNCVVSESADLKRRYEEQFKSDDVQMYGYWPQAFRWTCCGLSGDQRMGVSRL